jgi:hypothetical protein
MQYNYDDAVDLIEDAYLQFSIEMDPNEGWMCDGGLSTLARLESFLLERNRLEKHPTKDWVRLPDIKEKK